MKKTIYSLLLMLSISASATAASQPAVIFTQEVIAIGADGKILPPVKIEPENLEGMQNYDFDLGLNRLLSIQTNIRNIEERGLSDLVATVKRCYSYIEGATGQQLERGVLLYLIEVDEVPYAYSFKASYENASQWGEVRLALIEKNTTMSGQNAAKSLADLLYDTLPHELGHDVLSRIPQLVHDRDGDKSSHTRWFIEGICEVLAKGFSAREMPVLYKDFLALRNPDKVLAGEQMSNNLLHWAQNNENGMTLESDLYGAAMLAMMSWTEIVPLPELLAELKNRHGQVRGTDLLEVLHETTGLTTDEMLRRASEQGKKLAGKALLAQLENKG